MLRSPPDHVPQQGLELNSQASQTELQQNMQKHSLIYFAKRLLDALHALDRSIFPSKLSDLPVSKLVLAATQVEPILAHAKLLDLSARPFCRHPGSRSTKRPPKTTTSSKPKCTYKCKRLPISSSESQVYVRTSRSPNSIDEGSCCSI